NPGDLDVGRLPAIRPAASRRAAMRATGLGEFALLAGTEDVARAVGDALRAALAEGLATCSPLRIHADLTAPAEFADRHLALGFDEATLDGEDVLTHTLLGNEETTLRTGDALIFHAEKPAVAAATCDGPGHATTVAHLHGAATRGCGEAEFLFRLSLAGGLRCILLAAAGDEHAQGCKHPEPSHGFLPQGAGVQKNASK